MNTQGTTVQWVTAAPMWGDLVHAGDAGSLAAFRQPAILRFATDTFMDEFQATLQTAPLQVGALRLKAETWNGPAPTPLLPSRSLQQAVELRKRRGTFTPKQALDIARQLSTAPQLPQANLESLDLKLYQPAHQRYYLITGCLVCRTPGLPDRVINLSAKERVSFVVRRLRAKPNKTLKPGDATSYDEYAFVEQGTGRGWQLVSDPETLPPDEERLPLFPITYDEMDGRKRRLFSGLVPVSRREAYVHATELKADGTIKPAETSMQPADPREVQLMAQVIEPWKALIDRAERAWFTLNPQKDPQAESVSGDDAKLLLQNTRNDIQGLSWLILLDLAKWLAAHAEPLWNAIQANSPTSLQGKVEALAAYGAITAVVANDALLGEIAGPNANVNAMSLDEALRLIDDPDSKLEMTTVPYSGTLGDPWPSFRFPLADPQTHDTINKPNIVPLVSSTKPLEADQTEFQRERNGLDELAPKLVAALSAQSVALPPLPLVAQPVMGANEVAWFVIRMAFECPTCGALKPAIVSAPTEPFQMASFYDPDAPARPLRIAMPLDTSPAGLRKFDKNTAFMVSDMLCGQVQKARSLGLGDLVRSVLPWPLHKDLDASAPSCEKDGLSIGMMCSLSIPIITICAFILLMVMVSLLDFIFRWMPFFILCFPVPNLKGKP